MYSEIDVEFLAKSVTTKYFNSKYRRWIIELWCTSNQRFFFGISQNTRFWFWVQFEIQIVSEITHRTFVCTDYNFALYKPKKNQCQLHTRYNSSKNSGNRSLEIDYRQHIIHRCQKDEPFMCCSQFCRFLLVMLVPCTTA